MKDQDPTYQCHSCGFVAPASGSPGEQDEKGRYHFSGCRWIQPSRSWRSHRLRHANWLHRFVATYLYNSHVYIGTGHDGCLTFAVRLAVLTWKYGEVDLGFDFTCPQQDWPNYEYVTVSFSFWRSSKSFRFKMFPLTPYQTKRRTLQMLYAQDEWISRMRHPSGISLRFPPGIGVDE